MIENVCPTWFAGFDAVMQAVFVIVTLFVAIAGFRIYRFFGQERYKLHALGFLLLSAGYLILTLTNCALYASLRGMEHVLPGAGIHSVVWFGNILFGALFLTGLTMLLILYLNIKEPVQRLLFTVFAVLASLIATIDPTPWSFGLLHVLSAALLIFILVRLLQNEHKTRNSYLVIIAFIALVAGEVLTSVTHILANQTLYVLSISATLVGFLLILTSLVWHK